MTDNTILGGQTLPDDDPSFVKGFATGGFVGRSRPQQVQHFDVDRLVERVAKTEVKVAMIELLAEVEKQDALTTLGAYKRVVVGLIREAAAGE